MILVVDAGNSRIKWGVHDGLAWVAQEVAAHDGIAHIAGLLRSIPDIESAVISNVAGPGVQAALGVMLDEFGIEANWISPQTQACGVSNGYTQPSQLGSDRWAALVAAWNRTHSACVVANAGTALTVDALSSRGEFLGGLIVPGLSMMKAALNANTAGIAFTDGRLCDFPASTGDAVHCGALMALAGAAARMCQNLGRREGAEPVLLLSGGDAAALHEALSGHGKIMDNLVLEGLLLIAGEIRK